MKIYTKTGDKGQTSLIGGTRVAKNSVRLEAYGTVDELNSYLGLIRSFPVAPELNEQLIVIQNILFSVGGNLATDTSLKEVRGGYGRGCSFFGKGYGPDGRDAASYDPFYFTWGGAGFVVCTYSADGLQAGRETGVGCCCTI